MKTDLCLWPTLAFLAIACISGCTDPQAAPVLGRWVLEKPDHMLERIGGDNADQTPDVDSIDDSNSTPRMAITFYSSGQFETQTAMGNVNRQKNGTWQVISLDEAARKMTIRCTIGPEETDHVVQLIDESTIRLVPPNMAGLTTKMRFVRDR